MSDFVRRTTRFWAVAEGVYALVLALLVVFVVPWKTPAANVAVLLYAVAHGVAAPGLWRCRRWGHRLSLAAGLLGLLGAAVVCGGLVASWAYLRGIYGDFGRGASLAALMIATAALQLLGLYPALLVRALLRREVRSAMATGRGLPAACLGLVLLPALLGVAVHERYRVRPLPPVAAAARDESLRALRAALEGRDPPERLPALVGVPAGRAPLRVALWHRGRAVARAEGEGADLEAAVRSAAAALASAEGVPAAARSAGRLRVDRVVARTPVLSEWGPVLALSVDPGLDGLGRCAEGGCRVLGPDDLAAERLFGVAPLVPGIEELRLGLDAGRLLALLPGPGRLERFRVEGWVESGGRALPVVRGNTPAPGRGPEAWRAAALAGGDFILRQIRPDGRFHYVYDPLSGEHREGGGYSIPRHAGTIYSLALLYGETGEPRFRRGADRAIEWLARQIPEGCGAARGACVPTGRNARLGPAALTAIGLLEHQRRTGDDRHAETARRLVEFLLFMQREDGELHHRFDLPTGEIDPDERRMFESEQAALAFVLAHEVSGDERYLRAAERALDYLTGPKYDFFVGRFAYGADHWTCIAAEEAWPRLRSRQYLDFCRGYASFMRRIQYRAGRGRREDFAGHYGFGYLAPPQGPAGAAMSEAAISTWVLSRHHGRPDPAVREQVRRSLDALARDQIRADNSWTMREPRRAAGGVRQTLVEQQIRIDFTQHAASALLRGAAMEPGDEPPRG